MAWQTADDGELCRMFSEGELFEELKKGNFHITADDAFASGPCMMVPWTGDVSNDLIKMGYQYHQSRLRMPVRLRLARPRVRPRPRSPRARVLPATDAFSHARRSSRRSASGRASS